ncbi:MAG TPA: hypothetical protein VLN26_05060, partial [Gaiellaceae bacterium]|nr:hypothetical protein [Gaiellaceae bacterium]
MRQPEVRHHPALELLVAEVVENRSGLFEEVDGLVDAAGLAQGEGEIVEREGERVPVLEVAQDLERALVQLGGLVVVAVAPEPRPGGVEVQCLPPALGLLRLVGDRFTVEMLCDSFGLDARRATGLRYLTGGSARDIGPGGDESGRSLARRADPGGAEALALSGGSDAESFPFCEGGRAVAQAHAGLAEHEHSEQPHARRG